MAGVTFKRRAQFCNTIISSVSRARAQFTPQRGLFLRESFRIKDEVVPHFHVRPPETIGEFDSSLREVTPFSFMYSPMEMVGAVFILSMIAFFAGLQFLLQCLNWQPKFLGKLLQLALAFASRHPGLCQCPLEILVKKNFLWSSVQNPLLFWRKSAKNAATMSSGCRAHRTSVQRQCGRASRHLLRLVRV